MIRFTWRQFRTQGAVALGALVVMAVVSAITGPHLVQLYNTTVATCRAHGDCTTAATAFLRNDSSLRTWLGIVVIVAPGLMGVFWGAPLVAREIEAGTVRLAWTQSVTRTRWLAAKLGVIGLASVAVAGFLSLMLTWWASPLDRVAANSFGSFDQRDIVPLGYAAFAFALGVTAGVLIRRTLPAMAATVVVFTAARLTFARWIRPHLIASALRNLPLNPVSTGFGSENGGPFTLQPNPPNMPNAWVYSTQIVDKAGRPLSARFVANVCPGLGAGATPAGGSGGGPSRVPTPAGAQQALNDCVAKVGSRFHEVVAYQPASRYWLFQWYELAIFLGAALVLGGLCFWWVRRRLT